jgi:Secretion system C-terminal sorting domain
MNFINGVAQQGSSSTDTRTTTVDGYDTLKLPGGVSLPCLGLRQQSNSSPTASDLTFFYVTSTGSFIAINSFFGQSDTETISISDIEVIEGTLPTAVRYKPQTPASFALGQNYPNPFNPTTVISYQLSATSNVTLKVYGILGREVATVVNERQDAGSYNVTFDGSRLASGVYFYRLKAKSDKGRGFVSTKKVMLVK